MMSPRSTFWNIQLLHLVFFRHLCMLYASLDGPSHHNRHRTLTVNPGQVSPGQALQGAHCHSCLVSRDLALRNR
ncbi:hypothetical protein BDV32DRAFT_118259 [Aspergillus pseudonomiae]|nr:hypothetical protein BDV32DRAFT_118259 [Aspergillus pseudonomiae]